MQTSIALCTYNGARFLQRQLDSFAKQTTVPFELVVCDDGSSDETGRILNEFSTSSPYPVRIFKNENPLGTTRNFERAIGLCRGDLIALADQDDEWYPDKLAAFEKFFREFPRALAAFSDADLIDPDGHLLKKRLWRRIPFSPAKAVPSVDPQMLSTLLRLNNVATGATMVLRAQLRSDILPIPETWVHDAWIIWLAAMKGGAGVLPRPTIRYRIHPGQQLGLDPTSIAERLGHARGNAVKDYIGWIRRLEDLRAHLESKNECQSNEVLPMIGGKIDHFKGRIALSDSFPSRVWWVLSSWRRYRRYARGAVSMLKDMFFTAESVIT
jgi:glycosyltransferase involved in cell wall biosynthesis